MSPLDAPGATPPASPPGPRARPRFTAGAPGSHPRRALHIAGLAAAAAIVAVLAASLAGRAYARQQWHEALEIARASLGPLDLAGFLRPPVPDNAVPHFLAAARRSAPEDVVELATMNAVAHEPLESWPPPAETEALLARYRTVVDELHRGGEAGGFDLGVDYRRGWRTPRPNLVAYNLTGRLLLAHGRWSLAAGDEAAALASARALAIAAGGLEREPPLVAKIFGSIAERRLHRLAAAAIQEGVSAGTLAELRGLLAGLPRPIDLRQTLAYDAAAMVQELERRPAGGLQRVRAELCAGEAITRYAELANLQSAEIGEVVRAAAAETGETPPVRALRRRSDRGSWWASLCVQGEAFKLPYLGMEHEAVHLLATESARALAETALAVALHARATGGYPPALDGVTPGVPAPLTGEPVDYRLLPGGGASVGYPTAATTVVELGGLHRRHAALLSWELPAPR